MSSLGENRAKGISCKLNLTRIKEPCDEPSRRRLELYCEPGLGTRGLAVALWDALIERGGLWFGWSGGTTGRETRDLTLVAEGNVDSALVGLTEAEHEGYYLLEGGRPRGRDSRVHVTKTRDKAAALKFQSQVIKRHGRAEEIVTDGLRSYGAALKELGAEDRQVTGRWENNRAENSHQPFRRRERAMLRFRRMHSLQKFVSVHSSISNLFNSDRSLSSRDTFKPNRAAALAKWRGLCAN